VCARAWAGCEKAAGGRHGHIGHKVWLCWYNAIINVAIQAGTGCGMGRKQSQMLHARRHGKGAGAAGAPASIMNGHAMVLLNKWHRHEKKKAGAAGRSMVCVWCGGVCVWWAGRR